MSYKYKVGDVVKVKQEVVDEYKGSRWSNNIIKLDYKLKIHFIDINSLFPYGYSFNRFNLIRLSEDEIEGYADPYHNYNLRNIGHV